MFSEFVTRFINWQMIGAHGDYNRVIPGHMIVFVVAILTKLPGRRWSPIITVTMGGNGGNRCSDALVADMFRTNKPLSRQPLNIITRRRSRPLMLNHLNYYTGD